uniref:Uncharacterized protein n=1 Tax=Cajanus cajan TaxID=3821 RepID=A0A151SWX1_CAJCA|nr:hypothetical protein KK1_014713 [Cajanus cajan]
MEEVIRLILESIGSNNIFRCSHRRKVVHCNQEKGYDQLFNDYFSDNSVYTKTQFQRRFRMRRHVFLRIVIVITNHDKYF